MEHTGMVTRRTVLRTGGVAAATGLAGAAAGCGGSVDPASQQIAGPKEVAWSSYEIGLPEQQAWDQQFRLAESTLGVKITNVWEPQLDYWTKRQAEYAAGSANLDAMINSLSWVVSGGLSGLFVDHTEYLRRDKVDTRQYYKADLESWSWKGKQWGLPMQAGGEVVMYNKSLFDAKGIKYPSKDWTYDEFLETCKRLTDAASNKFALLIGQNGIHYMAGTFILNFGGKRLNEAKDKALYGDDPKSIQGTTLNVDLHTRYRVTPTAEATATLPPRVRAFEAELVAMEINGIYRYTSARPALGAAKLDFAPPPKGPTGIQTATVAGDGWSILSLAKAKDAAWRVLRWLHTKEGMSGPALPVLSWPALIPVANSPAWLDQFKGTRIAEATRVWETGGHDLTSLPEGATANTTMNGPLNDALAGKIATVDAMRESARALNELFGRRPAAWR